MIKPTNTNKQTTQNIITQHKNTQIKTRIKTKHQTQQTQHNDHKHNYNDKAYHTQTKHP